VGHVVQAIISPVEGAVNAAKGIFTGNLNEIGQGFAGMTGMGLVPGNSQNYVMTGKWGPTGATGGGGGLGLSTPTLNPLPSGTPSSSASSGPTNTPGQVGPISSGAATPVGGLSTAQRGALSAAALGQLAGLTKADAGSGMNGLSPQTLANQDAWATGYTNQTPAIESIIQNYASTGAGGNGTPGLISPQALQAFLNGLGGGGNG